MTGMVTGSVAAEVARIYQEGIVDPGKEPALFALLAFLVTFGLVRAITHMIRRGSKWWPGNLEVKGMHIHHLVWGILLLIVVGYLGVVLEPASPWHEVLAILFGVGAALTLDEFALWLNLRDVYWSHEGRRSIDAVIGAGILGALVLMGFSVWVDLANEVRFAAQVAVGAVGLLGLALVNALKGKYVWAVVSLLVPVAGLVGALRLARPGSPWSRLHTDERRALAKVRYGRGSAGPGAPLEADADERQHPGELRGDRTQQGDRDRDEEGARGGERPQGAEGLGGGPVGGPH
jgi:hypothetical protein